MYILYSCIYIFFLTSQFCCCKCFTHRLYYCIYLLSSSPRWHGSRFVIYLMFIYVMKLTPWFLFYQFIPPSIFTSLYVHSIYFTYPVLLLYNLISDTRQHRQVRMTLPHLFYSAVTDFVIWNFKLCYMHPLLVFPIVLWIFFGDLPPVILYSDKQYVYNTFWLHWIHWLLILYYYHLVIPSMFISLYLHSIYSTNGLLVLYVYLIPGSL